MATGKRNPVGLQPILRGNIGSVRTLGRNLTTTGDSGDGQMGTSVQWPYHIGTTESLRTSEKNQKRFFNEEGWKAGMEN